MSLFAALPADVRRRFARQLVLPELGPGGQQALLRASLLLVGVGGLGTPVASYLVRAGIGRLTILDPGMVDEPDLHRQTLYLEHDLGHGKASTAAARLLEIGGPTRVEGFAAAFAPGDARERVRDHDLVVDASDNPATRYLVSDACVLESRPLVFGAVSRLEGQVAVLAGGSEPCYRCLHPEPPPADAVPGCAEAGVLGPVAGVVGSLMAFESICLLAGVPRADRRGLLHLDLGRGVNLRVSVARRPGCVACGSAATMREVRLDEAACRVGEPYPGA